MSKPTTALTPVKPKMLLAACDAFLSNWDQRVAREIEKAIVERIGLKRWFRKPLTREEATAEIHARNDVHWNQSVADSIRNRGGYWREKVKRLRAMALITPPDQDMYIDERGVESLEGFLNGGGS